MRQEYHHIYAWTADDIERIHLHWIMLPHCPVSEAPKSSFGEGHWSSWQLIDYRLYFQMMILAPQGDEPERREAKPYLQDRVVATSEVIFGNMKCISPKTIMVPNILHTVYLSMLNHLIDWVRSFLKQHSSIDKFKQLWAMMPPYPGFTRFNKPYIQVTQWRAKEMKSHGHLIGPVFCGDSFQHFDKSKDSHHRSPVVHSERSVFLPYRTVPVQCWSHNWVLGELSGEVSSSEWCIQLIPRHYIYKEGLGRIETAADFGHTTGTGVTPGGKIFLRLQGIAALIKIRHGLSQRLLNILSTNRISTIRRCMTWTTSLTIFASLATFQMQPLKCQKEWWWILNMCTGNLMIRRPPSRSCKQPPKRRCFSIECSMHSLHNNVATMKCL